MQLLSRVRNCLRTADLQEHVYFPQEGRQESRPDLGMLL